MGCCSRRRCEPNALVYIDYWGEVAPLGSTLDGSGGFLVGTMRSVRLCDAFIPMPCVQVRALGCWLGVAIASTPAQVLDMTSSSVACLSASG